MKLIDSNRFREQCTSTDKYLRDLITNTESKRESFSDDGNDFQLDSIIENKLLHSDSKIKKKIMKNASANKKSIQKKKRNERNKPSLVIPNEIFSKNSTEPKTKRLSRSKKAIAERAAIQRSDSQTKAERNARVRQQNEGICPICGKFTKGIYGHIRSHGTSRNVECDYCNKTFYDKQYLKRHFKIHFNIKQFECKLCPYKFIRQTNLNQHMRTHTGEKPFKCHMCAKCFTTSSSRREHERSHLQDRNVSCPYCDKLFLTKKYLKSHIGVHTGERPFKCELCDGAFIASSALAIHRQRVHKNQLNANQCNVCWMIFKSRAMLRHHLRDHGINDLKVGALAIINDKCGSIDLK